MRRLFFLILSLTIVIACNKDKVSNEKPIAEAYDDYLYASDISKILVNNEMDAKDSIQFVNNYIKNWVINKIFVKQGEKFFEDDPIIEERVTQYKESLLRHNYEQAIVTDKTKSDFSFDEINEYYESFKENYLLERPLYRVIYAKVPVGSQLESICNSKWKGSKVSEMESAVTQAMNEGMEHSFDEEWHTITQLSSILTDLNIGEDLSKGRKISGSGEAFANFLYVVESKKKGDEAPLEYIKAEISNILLYKKKNEVLDLLSEQLLKSELKKGKVNFYDEK